MQAVKNRRVWFSMIWVESRSGLFEVGAHPSALQSPQIDLNPSLGSMNDGLLERMAKSVQPH
jgi:hypothetical protein